MSKTASNVCLCGEPTDRDYAPGHDARHASELALAVHRGALTEDDARRLIPTPDTVSKFESVLASRNSGRFRGNIQSWGAWLDDVIRG